jgi:hypothetical protein
MEVVQNNREKREFFFYLGPDFTATHECIEQAALASLQSPALAAAHDMMAWSNVGASGFLRTGTIKKH